MSPIAIKYNVNVASIPGHIFEVKLAVENPDPQGQVLTLPAWIPGSYMIRDFAKNIISIEAQTANSEILPIHKLDKQTWKLPACKQPIVVTYRVYAYDLSVRGAYINDEFAFFNGTNLFLEVIGQTDQPCMVTLEKPVIPETINWRVATTLANTQIGHHQFGDYLASNYAELIDHPVLIGEFDRLPFSAAGVDFELILAGGHQADVERMVQDLQIICQHHIDFFADIPPVKRYLFITLLTDHAFGGLEHLSSTALMYSRKDLPSKYKPNEMTDGYRVFLSLCSHEFFHTWHVKRIRPVELFESSLATEQYTEQLWIYEGFTSYYDDLSLLRCGLIDQPTYLKIMAQNLTRLIRNKGRFKQSISESSFDAWTKFYKQDEGAINNIVSYYNKGAVLAMCLDLNIRLLSDDQFCLDDVLQHLWQQHGKTSVPTPVNVIQTIVAEQFGLELDGFFQTAIYTRQELPFTALLEKFGVSVQVFPRTSSEDKGGELGQYSMQVDFGAQSKPKETGIQISQVTEDTAAYNAGLQVGDLLIAINQWELNQQNLVQQLNELPLGESAQLTVLRDKKLKHLTFVAGAAVADTVALSITDKSLVNRWLSKIMN